MRLVMGEVDVEVPRADGTVAACRVPAQYGDVSGRCGATVRERWTDRMPAEATAKLLTPRRWPPGEFGRGRTGARRVRQPETSRMRRRRAMGGMEMED